jgi:hypothetical protein
VRQTSEGVPVYRVTRAGQQWALAQLATPGHWLPAGGKAANYSSSTKPVGASAEPVIETRGAEWRVVDYVRHVCTPWMSANMRTSIMERAAKRAVRDTNPNRLTQRHTRDAGWVIVHSL